MKNHLRRGTAVNAKDEVGLTPLHYAAGSCQIEIMEFLIKKGAEVNVEADPERKEGTPLEAAAMGGCKDAVELLIKKGADFKKYGPNAIDLAVYMFGEVKKHSVKNVPPWMDYIGVVKVLVKKVKPRDQTLFTAVEEGYIEIVRLLIESGVNLNAKDVNGYTPLHIAVERNFSEIAKLLIKSGADLNSKGVGLLEETPLHLAIKEGNNEMVKLLLESGADVNARDSDGETPLHTVVWSNKISPESVSETISILIKHGADVNAKNYEGETPLDLAIKTGKERIANELRKYGAKKTTSRDEQTKARTAAPKKYEFVAIINK